jgi:hypothetical protein
MAGHGEKMNRVMSAVVQALVMEPTVALAARRAGVARSSIFRWYKRPVFRAALDAALISQAAEWRGLLGGAKDTP